MYISFSDKVTLRDLKACKLAPIVINTFMNLEKYLEYEQRDPVLAAAAKVMDTPMLVSIGVGLHM